MRDILIVPTFITIEYLWQEMISMEIYGYHFVEDLVCSSD